MTVHSISAGSLAAIMAVALAACGKPAEDRSMPAADAAATAAVLAEIPESLAPFGQGWPKAGDPCRRLGESPATVNWLDDSAILVGCPTAEAAAALGGKVLATVEGVTVVTVPTGDANAGMPAADGDAKVAGTDYNATAELPCSFDGGDTLQRCKAGVKRKWGEDGTTLVEVTKPDGRMRALFFKGTQATSADSAQADGSAAYAFNAERMDDETRISFGPERYVVPDAFVVGG
jgi:hypothetical protein